MNDWTRREFLAASALAAAQAEAPKKAGDRRETPRAAGQEPKPAAGPGQREDRAGLHRRRRHGDRPDQHLQEVSRGRRSRRSATSTSPTCAGPGRQAGGTPEAYGDFRRVLDRKDIDAVVIATPDHWHGITDHPGLPGRQGRLLREAAGAPHPGRPGHGAGGRKVQARHPDGQPDPRRRKLPPRRRDRPLGRPGQDQQDPGLDGRRPQRAGASRGWPAARRAATTTSGSGPAPSVPFNPNRFTFNWRYFWDYGGGILTDFCCHIVDLVHWAMDVDAPRTISAVGRPLRPGRQRRGARYARGHLRIPEGRPEVLDGLEPDRRQHARPRKQGPGHHVSGDRGHAGGRLRHVPDHPREGPEDRRAAQDPAALGRPSPRVARLRSRSAPSARATSATATA